MRAKIVKGHLVYAVPVSDIIEKIARGGTIANPDGFVVLDEEKFSEYLAMYFSSYHHTLLDRDEPEIDKLIDGICIKALTECKKFIKQVGVTELIRH